MPETIGTRRAWRIPVAFTFFVSELEMSAGENHNHATRLVVERRFFARAVMYIDHLHVFIFKSQLIMLGFNLGGILR